MNKIAVTVDELLYRIGEKDPNVVQEFPEARAVTQLPNLTEAELVSNIITTILQFSMGLTMVALIVAGIFLLISRGNEDETGKAKKIITYLVIGLLIISAAYAIVTGIAKINFFQAS